MSNATTVLDPANVRSVYSGDADRCACGCSGKHTYATAHADEAALKRGYPLLPEDMNDRTVRMHCKKIASVIVGDLEGTVITVSRDHVAVTVGNRMYVAYFAGAA